MLERAKESLISTLAQELRSSPSGSDREVKRLSPEVEEELLTAFESNPGVESLGPSYQVEFSTTYLRLMCCFYYSFIIDVNCSIGGH